jgi:uncharacterized protein
MLAVFAAAVLLAQAPPLPPPNAARTVRSPGEGHISVAPDVAHIVVGVDAQDEKIGRANADATARMRKVMDTIEKAGIAAKDVRTVRYSVEPVRSFNNNPPNQSAIVGYRVVNQVLVTLRDLRRIGDFLDRVVTAGANDLGELTFEKEDVSVERARALDRAVADARARATTLAKAAGGTLGEALQVNEAAHLGVPYSTAVRVSMSSGPPVAAGELEIYASVEVVFALR